MSEEEYDSYDSHEREIISTETTTVGDNDPYIIKTRHIIEKEYLINPKYDGQRECKCGDTYERHFDGYENWKAVGCKYCDCVIFDAKE